MSVVSPDPRPPGHGPAPGEPGVGKADAVEGAEDLTDEEEEELTYEVASRNGFGGSILLT